MAPPGDMEREFERILRGQLTRRRLISRGAGRALWSDNMQVPGGAPHAFTAQKFMDFVYRPAVQADITAWVNYVCPVKGVRELLERSDPELAESELIFPSPESLTASTDLRPLAGKEAQEVESAFQPAIGA